MIEFVTVANLQTFAPDIDPAKAQEMIDDATALAVLAAPCLADLDPVDDRVRVAAVKAVIRGAILRWEDAGSGAISAKNTQAGPFGETVSVDTRQPRRSMFWPSELTQLQGICKGPDSGGAYSVDTAPMGAGGMHSETCSLMLGATYCSCGAGLSGGLPLWP